MIRIADIITIKDDYLHYYFFLGANYAMVEKIMYDNHACLPSLLMVRWLDGKTNDVIVPFHHATKISSEDDSD